MAMTRKDAVELIVAIDARNFLAEKLNAVVQYLNDNELSGRMYKVNTIVKDIPVEFYVTGNFMISELVNTLESANKQVVAKGG